MERYNFIRSSQRFSRPLADNLQWFCNAVSFIFGVFIQLSDIARTEQNRITFEQWYDILLYRDYQFREASEAFVVNIAFFPIYLEVVDGLSKILVRIALHGLRGDWSHIVVHHSEFHKGQEDEHAARRHPHVDRFHVRDWRQRLLRLCVLSSWKKNINNLLIYSF